MIAGTMNSESDQHHRQVDLPVLAFAARPPVSLQGERHHHEHRHLRGVQRKDAEIQAQQLACRAAHPCSRAGAISASEWKWLAPGSGMTAHTTPIASQRQHAGQGEHAGHADRLVQRRAEHHAKRRTSGRWWSRSCAMALVRCSSRVRSASSAVTAAEIAPAPCIDAADDDQ